MMSSSSTNQEARLRKVELYDTTLRDGSQSEDISFSVEDKYAIALKLDKLGIDYIEAGWPGANPKDDKLFKAIKDLALIHAKIIAFGSTCKPGLKPEQDKIIKALIDARPFGVTIVGKSMDTHVKSSLKCSLEENLRIIADTIGYLKGRFPYVAYDAEHFFDGFIANKDYAVKTLKAAIKNGADRIVLCDTNGGMIPSQIADIVKSVRKEVKAPLGIHCHNDGDLAVANTISAVSAGVDHVQGTINGIGERCGNANLCSIIPNLSLKAGYKTIPEENMKMLLEISRFVDEVANLPPNRHQPYVGDSAFAHKGGIHVSAVMKDPMTYEHVDPGVVGNKRRILVSEQSGKSNIIYKAREFNVDLIKESTSAQEIVNIIKDLEDSGFQFEGADASLELLMKKAMGMHARFFKLKGFRVIVDKHSDELDPISEATIMIEVDNRIEHTAALGNGPVNALDSALRKALEKFYPRIKEVELLDYKVRVLSSSTGTGSVVRVLIESGDKKDRWNTVGVSANIIEASWIALVDSLDYKIYKDTVKEQKKV
jgi:2-isopropylmalate synthase